MDHNTLIDFYFTITAAAVIVLAVLVAVVLIYLISIIRTIRRIVRTAEFATEVLKEDVAELRASIKARGLSLGALFDFFKHLARVRILPKRKK
jgi:hypothetical protein